MAFILDTGVPTSVSTEVSTMDMVMVEAVSTAEDGKVVHSGTIRPL
jgi:hypothetical protein